MVIVKSFLRRCVITPGLVLLISDGPETPDGGQSSPTCPDLISLKPHTFKRISSNQPCDLITVLLN